MKRAGVTVTLENGESHTKYLTLVGIKDGFWLDNTGNKLQQVNGFTTDVFFGENVKIQINTFNVKDGRKIDIKIKAQIGGNNASNFQEIIHTIKVENNIAILEYFYIAPEWYDETVEEYYSKNTTVNGFNAKAHQTTVHPDEAITFVFEAKFENRDWDKAKSFPKNENDYLKPITYRRNYEELFGLYKYNDTTRSKDLSDNYENEYIEGNSEITTLVNEFLEFIQNENLKVEGDDGIKKRVEKDAQQLWELAVQQVQNGNIDDRSLYWARNKMQVYLKRHPVFKEDIDFETSLINKNTPLARIITLFEKLSRNYGGVDFSKAGNKKKVLVTGFDPFQLDLNNKQSNPSGLVALALHNNDKLGAYIQTMIFPVRYTDFDKSTKYDEGQDTGVIEKYIGDVISDVDAIITVSQSFPDAYNIDVFATATRGGFEDNMNYKRKKVKALSNDCPETIVTTLPKTFEYGKTKYYGKYFETEEAKDGYETYHYKDSTQNNKQIIDLKIKDFEQKDKSGYYNSKPLEYQKDKELYDKFKVYKKHSNSQKDCDITNFPKGNIFSGPGSNYLSNEIFYRVAKLRKDHSKKLPTGHFHISKIQGEDEDLNSGKIQELLKTVKETLINGFKGI